MCSCMCFRSLAGNNWALLVLLLILGLSSLLVYVPGEQDLIPCLPSLACGWQARGWWVDEQIDLLLPLVIRKLMQVYIVFFHQQVNFKSAAHLSPSYSFTHTHKAILVYLNLVLLRKGKKTSQNFFLFPREKEFVPVNWHLVIFFSGWRSAL
jgi:hypothetical protein